MAVMMTGSFVGVVRGWVVFSEPQVLCGACRRHGAKEVNQGSPRKK